jgi:hypothetical protein
MYTRPWDKRLQRLSLNLLQLVRVGHSRGVDMISVLLEMAQVRFTSFSINCTAPRLLDLLRAALTVACIFWSGDADRLCPGHAMARGRRTARVGSCVLTCGAHRSAGLQNLCWYQN